MNQINHYTRVKTYHFDSYESAATCADELFSAYGTDEHLGSRTTPTYKVRVKRNKASSGFTVVEYKREAKESATTTKHERTPEILGDGQGASKKRKSRKKDRGNTEAV